MIPPLSLSLSLCCSQATLAALFTVDEFDQEELFTTRPIPSALLSHPCVLQEYDLPSPAGLYTGVSDQYLFNAEYRLVDPGHYFFWVPTRLPLARLPLARLPLARLPLQPCRESCGC